MIIGINGYAGSGKDTIAAIIQYLLCENKEQLNLEMVVKYYSNHQWWLEEQSGWEIKKFAGKLKTIANILTGIPEQKFEDREFKLQNMPAEWTRHGIPMTVREFLQRLGTDGLRNNLCDNVWVNSLMVDYKPTHDVEFAYTENGSRIPVEFNTSYPNWIITDCRFNNEATAIKNKNGIIIRVDRPGVKPVNKHVSETALDNWNFDYKIANVSDLIALAFTVENILKKENILK
jgi:hypothetical protein